jgi:hypothetical protein
MHKILVLAQKCRRTFKILAENVCGKCMRQIYAANVGGKCKRISETYAANVGGQTVRNCKITAPHCSARDWE